MITINPLRVGTIYCDKGKTITQGVDNGKMIYVPSVSWLIKTPTEKILVDTGMPDTHTSHSFHYHGSYQLPGERIDQALKINGIKPEEITKVILTHLHWDHCQNGHLLPNAIFYIQKKEIEFARNPSGTYFRSYDHPALGLTPAFEQYPIKELDGDAEIAPGVSVILTPGHSPGHQIVVVHCSQTYVIAGDAVLCYDNLLPSMQQDYVLPGRHKDSAETQKVIEKIIALAGATHRILPGHDEKVFRKKEYF
ncbi:MAG: N-acyl homoserine lactonase family protein [Nanoarchaeota archaeon]|nr:N-acyl homoserine lactonase family protein [Nanoarchaeota archaeon]